jgi:Predicted pPIWI-associating nuclease
MPGADSLLEDRSVFWQSFEDFSLAIEKKKNSTKANREILGQARALSQTYFRVVKPELDKLGISQDLQQLDSKFQLLLALANSNSTVGKYRAIVVAISQLRPQIEVKVELAVSSRLARTGFFGGTLSPMEQAIIETLDGLVPTAGSSYRQALSDLRDYKRVSFRGTASELRECIREVLDHLAPDDQVSSAPTFKPEDNQTKPTMKQKARFILKARKVADGARQVPENVIGLVDQSVDNIASLPRALYTQGSFSTHISQTRAQVMQLKLYTDAILAEMLQLSF